MHTPTGKSESYPYAGVPSPQQPTAPFHSEDYLAHSPYPVAYPAPYPTTQPYHPQGYVPHYPYPYYQGKLPGLANPYAPRNPFLPPFDMGYADDMQRSYLAWNQPQNRPPLRPRPPGTDSPAHLEPNPDKPHPCGQPGCNLRFRRIEHARRHRDGVHFKLKPYACPYPSCGKKFARSDNLRQHIKSIHRKMSAASI